MRIPRPRYLGIGATILMALALFVARHGQDTNVLPPRARDQSESAKLASPNRARQDSIAAAPSRSPLSPALVTNASKVASIEGAFSIPTELPDSPILEQKLSRNGTSPDWREGYTYQLGLMAFYEECMGGRIKKGIIYYYITWQMDEDHLASSPELELADEPMQGDISVENRRAFEACVKSYLATHDHLYVPSASTPRMAWDMGAIFPLSDSPLLKTIAEATSK